MGSIDAGPDEDGSAAGLGAAIWRPPKALDERFRRVDRRQRGLRIAARTLTFVPVTIALFIVGAVALILLPVLGMVALVVIALWVAFFWPRSPAGGGLPLSVHDRGLVLPTSFQNVPGLERVGGPVALRFTEVSRVERIEEGGDLAVVVYTNSGGGGIVGRAMGVPGLTDEELREVVDGFVAAVERVGVAVIRQAGGRVEGETGEPPTAQG